MFRNLLIAAALMLVPAVSIAQEVNPCANIAEATRNKTDAQVRTILATCRADQTSEPVFTPEDASRWADATTVFAESIGKVAGELGMATNDFLKTPAGILIALILIVSFAGNVVIAMPFSVLSILFLYRVYKNTYTTVEYAYVPVLKGLFSIRKIVSREPVNKLNESQVMLLLVFTLATLILNAVVWAVTA